jgi:hypothetical protein
LPHAPNLRFTGNLPAEQSELRPRDVYADTLHKGGIGNPAHRLLYYLSMATAPAPDTNPSISASVACNRFAIAILLAVMVIAPLWHIHLINRERAPEKSDALVPIWVAARVALAGSNPYSAAATRQIQTAYSRFRPPITDVRFS